MAQVGARPGVRLILLLGLVGAPVGHERRGVRVGEVDLRRPRVVEGDVVGVVRVLHVRPVGRGPVPGGALGLRHAAIVGLKTNFECQLSLWAARAASEINKSK